MSRVFLAEEVELGRRVVIKVRDRIRAMEQRGDARGALFTIVSVGFDDIMFRSDTATAMARVDSFLAACNRFAAAARQAVLESG